MPAVTAILFCVVVGISDGDTLTARCDSAADASAQTIKVRLAEVDAPGFNDARIQLELLDKARADEDLGKSNLFAYRNSRPPEPTKVAPPPPPPVVTNNPPPRPTVVAPPPPPPIPLKYVGYAFVEPNSKVLIATLLDDTQQRHFNAVQGDIFMGRYRVLRITDTVVDVEDIDTSRRQTLPLVK